MLGSCRYLHVCEDFINDIVPSLDSYFVPDILQTAPILACIATLIIYVIDGKDLDAPTAFTALSLFYVLRVPLLVYPVVLTMSADAHVAIKRIRELLLTGELDSEPTRLNKDDSAEFGLTVEQGNFCWEVLDGGNKKLKDDTNADKQGGGNSAPEKKSASAEKKEESSEKSANKQEELKQAVTDNTHEDKILFTGLHGIELKVKKGSLVAVVGTVGSGKSSLLSAIVGEMKRLSGDVKCFGSVAYCAQQAWIQNMTLRDNILFGRPYDEHQYAEVIHVCALQSDLEMLPGTFRAVEMLRLTFCSGRSFRNWRARDWIIGRTKATR